VTRPEGNFLVEQGFERSPSQGIKGTSCYRLEWKGGHIELYGACAGWYGSDRGFTFIRPRRRCAIWLSGDVTPVPGQWQPEFIDKEAKKAELYSASLPFIDWLISYEHAVLARFGRGYREENFRRYKKVPKARVWVEPQVALRWFQCFLETPEDLVRPKRLGKRDHA